MGLRTGPGFGRGFSLPGRPPLVLNWNGQSGFWDVESALELPYTGTPYLWCPGKTTDQVTTPDAAHDPAGSVISWRAWVEAVDTTPATEECIAGKYSGSAERSWYMSVRTSGAVRLAWSADGATVLTADSTSPLPSGAVEIRADLDTATGDVTFYSRTDVSGSWSALGSTVSGAGATSVHAGTAAPCIGALNAASNAFNGKVFRFQLWDDATELLEFTPTDHSGKTYASVTSSATGEVWTVNRSTTGYMAHIVDRACFMFDGVDDYLQLADDPAYDCGNGEELTAAIEIFHPASAGAVDALLTKKGFGGNTGWAIGTNAADAANSDWYSGSGYADVGATLAGSRKVVATRRRGAEVETFVDGTGTGSPATPATTVDFSNTNTLRVGRYGGAGTSYYRGVVYGVRIWKRGLKSNLVAKLLVAFAVLVALTGCQRAASITDSFGSTIHMEDELQDMWTEYGYPYTHSKFGGQRWDERYAAAQTIAKDGGYLTPGVVVYMLGTNDVLQAAQGTRTLQDVESWIEAHVALWPSSCRIIFVNQSTLIENLYTGAAAEVATINAIYDRIAAERPNTAVVDWNSITNSQSGMVYDWVHPSAAGQVQLDLAVRAAL